MDPGANSYRRFLEGDDKGMEDIVGAYKDGLILYLNGFVNNIYTACSWELVSGSRGC